MNKDNSLRPFFRPSGIALIGASQHPEKLSFGILQNLLHPQYGFPGPVYPVNPKATEILGKTCYPDISQVPDPIELAIIIVPAPYVPATMEACGRRGLKAVIVITGGFREAGPDGKALEDQLVAIARQYGMRLMGPNGIGVIDTNTPLNTTFVKGMPLPGKIAFLSQSGALCGGVIDWSKQRGVGFSVFLSVGNEADVTESDLLPYLQEDPDSAVITLYIEEIHQPRRFLAVAKEVAAQKPVLALKSGRTASGQRATASHTGALASNDAAYQALFRQTGIVQVDTLDELFDSALLLTSRKTLAGPNIAIITNAGGPGALAADALERHGLHLAVSAPETIAALRPHLPAAAALTAPIDMLGGAFPEHYGLAVKAVLGDPSTDGIMVIHVPQAVVDAREVSREIIRARETVSSDKPVVACFLGGEAVAEAARLTLAADIPTFTFPNAAAAALGTLYQWQHRPPLDNSAPEPVPAADRRRVATIMRQALAEKRSTLGTVEAEALLHAYGIPTPRSALAKTAAEAVAQAKIFGYPVVLKLQSPDILHKSDVGGVLVGLADDEAVQRGFAEIMANARTARPGARLDGVLVQEMVHGGQEVIIGGTQDPRFGPLVMFGVGGVLVELLEQVTFRLAPVSDAEASRMIDDTAAAKLLTGLRGAPPADRHALQQAIVRVAQLLADFPQLRELDLNPLLVLPEGEGVCAVDPRLILG